MPLPRRDESRLLVWQKGELTHQRTGDLSRLVPPKSLFIVNDSRVIASRIRFNLKTGAQSELLLLEPTEVSGSTREAWLALGRPMKRFRQGMTLDLGQGLEACFISCPSSQVAESSIQPLVVQFSLEGEDLQAWLDNYGEMPLPPYIERRQADETTKTQDRNRYQTVYAKPLGSVAAPTAGLHFTPDILESLKEKGCEVREVTLHVGAGTFLPVKSSNINQHVMHAERYCVPKETLLAIEQAKSEARPVIVVGTTALRSLEGLAEAARQQNCDRLSLCDQWLRTQIFIRPRTAAERFRPWAADALMTNFHQPESTLFMLICALLGYDKARFVYAQAIASGYRFYSYGDSSLLWLNSSE